MCCESVGEFGVRDRLQLVVLGWVSGDGRVASRPGLCFELLAVVLSSARHHAAILNRVRREEKCNV